MVAEYARQGRHDDAGGLAQRIEIEGAQYQVLASTRFVVWRRWDAARRRVTHQHIAAAALLDPMRKCSLVVDITAWKRVHAEQGATHRNGVRLRESI